MAKMLLPILNNVSIGATGAQPGVRCNVTPFAGGFGRNTIYRVDHANGGSGVVTIEAHASNSATAPAAGDAGWYNLATISPTSPLEGEVILDRWVRANITVAGTGNQTINLEGIQ